MTKEESRSSSVSDGGKQQFMKERRQTTRDTGQKVVLFYRLKLNHVCLQSLLLIRMFS